MIRRFRVHSLECSDRLSSFIFKSEEYVKRLYRFNTFQYLTWGFLYPNHFNDQDHLHRRFLRPKIIIHIELPHHRFSPIFAQATKLARDFLWFFLWDLTYVFWTKIFVLLLIGLSFWEYLVFGRSRSWLVPNIIYLLHMLI